MSTLDSDCLVEGYSQNDKFQPLWVAIPAYVNIDTRFFVNFLDIERSPAGMTVDVVQGPYVQQNMRLAVQRALESSNPWERFLVLEVDMILPKDGLLKHALHTDDVVGSVYFQHAPPFYLNSMLKHPETGQLHHHTPEAVAKMIENPALYRVGAVGLGCTSIARRVLENWPDDVPMFITEMTSDHDSWKHTDTMGEISHDVYFCREADKLGHGIYLDSTLRCVHLTGAYTDASMYFSWAAKEKMKQQEKLILPADFDVERAKKARAKSEKRSGSGRLVLGN